MYTAQGNFTAPEKQQKLTQILLTRDSRFEYPNPASSLDTELAFLIPLVAGDKEMGILCLSSKTTRQAFSSDDIYLIQGLISVAAVSLRNALLLREVSIRDTFISIASHELRSPLTSIIGYAELLLRRQPPETTRQQWLTHIVDNGKRITSMADDLLNVTRIQTGKVSMKLEHVDLPEILNERLDMVKETSQKHEFFLKLDAGLPKALVDPDKFGQVVQNLLSNAVKYSPNGGLVVLSANRDATRNKVVVSVSDRGIGISPEDQEFLFITFHRIQRPETRGIRGSGLGLYIVKEWIEAMGGSVWLESELNKGSTFFVSVPASNSSNLN